MYGACGDATINGFVDADDGNITDMTWEWGDGIVHDGWFPASHHYTVNDSYTVWVTAHEDTGESLAESVAVDIANAGAAGCDYTLRLHPAVPLLRDGVTTADTWLELRDGRGNLVTTHDLAVTYTSSDPALVQVDADGRITGAGFGHAEVEVQIDGYPRSAAAAVVLGRFRVEPGIQLLSVNDNPTGPLTLYSAKADNSAPDLTGRTITWSGGNTVAGVGTGGLVTALSSPAGFWDSPYITARIDGHEGNNASFTRVTASSLGVALQLWQGEFTAFWVPDEIGIIPVAELMTNLQAVQVTDHAYRLESWLTGTRSAEGDVQYLALDPGPNDGTSPCGLSGNPLRLGFNVDTGDNCFGGADWLHWGIFYHEMAHNFLNQPAFQDWVSGLADPGDYVEGLATTLAMYAIDTMVKSPGDYEFDPATVNNLSRDSIFLTPAFIRTVHFSKLAAYELAPDYTANFDADIMDAIMTKLHDEYGPNFIYRVLSAFVATEEWRDLAFSDETQRLTFWVAVCSAAAYDAELKVRFKDSWGYPIDETFYGQVYPLAERLVARRDPAVDAGQDRTAPVGQTVMLDDAASFDWEGDPLVLTWQVDVRPAGSNANLSDPAILHPTFRPDVMGPYTLGLGAQDDVVAGARDALTLNACVLTSPSVNIGTTGSDVDLSWDNDFAIYDVYEDTQDPYLTPATATSLGPAAGAFTHKGALAPPYGSHYYLVQAQCGGQRLSNGVGAFQYELTAGS